MDLAVLTVEDPQIQENSPPNEEWTERASFSEGNDSLENNGLGEFTQASRHSTPLSETDVNVIMFTVRRKEHDPGQELGG